MNPAAAAATWLVAALLISSADAALRLPRIITSNMVLQAEHPALFGWADAGAKISITTNDTAKVYSTTAAANGTWGPLELDPRAASFIPVSINITEVAGSSQMSMVLENVLFGDVWVCSGQSNMEFSVAEMFESQSVIADADIPGLRMFAVQKNASMTEIPDIIDSQYGSWVQSAPSTVCGSEYGDQAQFCAPHCGPSAAVPSFKRDTWGYFSAVCYIHGRSLLKATNRPQGLLESCWGGTSIQKWSSEAALKTCDPKAKAPGDLWSGMIYPLLKFPVRGAIWYQGEANAGHGGNAYYCQMKALIQDWRAKWFQSHNMTFNLAQLAPSGDSSGGILRWSQLGATALPGVGIGINIDLYDEGSPCGSVHVRNKTVVGERLALNSMALSYNMDVNFRGPVISDVKLDPNNPNQLTVLFTTSAPPLRFVSVVNQTTNSSFQGFEVKTEHNKWIPALSATVSDGTNVVVEVPSRPAGLRFAWGDIPTGQALYDASNLPSSPFIFDCTNDNCLPVPYGNVTVEAIHLSSPDF